MVARLSFTAILVLSAPFVWAQSDSGSGDSGSGDSGSGGGSGSGTESPTYAPTRTPTAAPTPAALPAPTAAPVAGSTTTAPTLAPESETEVTVPLTIQQALSDMTAAERNSLTYNCIVELIERLNSVNAGGSTNLTTADVARAVLSATATRRSNTVYFSAFFNDQSVTESEAISAANTVTASNPFMASYTKADNTIATATATSASARAGTAAPTAAPKEEDEDTSLSAQGVVALAVVGAIFGAILLLGLVSFKLRQDNRDRAVHTKSDEPTEPRVTIHRTGVQESSA
mmetsp:Transcript_33730/g.88653  ORF Transcript_33730/g.88653 Transcript_33730/m.88653 type:complete len:287 (-) Transcript_33730:307-1167(-)